MFSSDVLGTNIASKISMLRRNVNYYFGGGIAFVYVQKSFRVSKWIPNLSSSIKRHLIQCDVLNHFEASVWNFPSNLKINWIALELCHRIEHINADSILKVPIFLSKTQEINTTFPIPELVLALSMCMDSTTMLPFHYHFVQTLHQK